MILLLLIVTIISFVAFVKWRQTYWQRKGIQRPPPDSLLGDVKTRFFGQTAIGQDSLQKYNAYKRINPLHGGFYFMYQPVYMPLDPALIKQMLTKDFQHFVNHGFYHHPKDVLSNHLFNMEDEPWKKLRAKLTPTFTSGKMKMMFETLVEKTVGLKKSVQRHVDNQEPICIKEILGRFTTDIIASCAFGIECNSLEEPDNQFRMYGKQIFKPKMYKQFFAGVLPWSLLGHIGFTSSGPELTKFFSDVVRDTIKTREVNKIFRKDFMHLLIQLKNQGFVSESTKIESKNKTEAQTLSEEEIIAQCFVFFLAGFETSSTNMTFTLLSLSQYPDIQEKLRKEINEVLDNSGGEIKYDDIMAMPYLDKVVNESLRKYPPLPFLPRKCTKAYEVPGTDVVIEKGTRVEIPVWGLHLDPEYYPNPEVFDPERFSPENKASRPDFTFLPFGEGPRMCIGLRFGVMQSKVGLVSLLSKFRFTLNEKKTKLPIQMDKGFVLSVKGDVWLDATEV